MPRFLPALRSKASTPALTGQVLPAARDAYVELLLARAVVVTRRGGAVRDRRGLFLGALALREPPRILVVVRAPLVGRRQISLAPPRPRS